MKSKPLKCFDHTDNLTMTRLVFSYCATAAFFLIIDLLWLGYIARSFYYERLGPMLLDKPHIGVAAAFYLVYVGGITYFAVFPALRAEQITLALLNGFLFGFFAYATYDITNLATLRNWPIAVTVVDITWGATLTCASAAVGYSLTRAIFGS